MDSSLLNVLHDARYDNIAVLVAEGVNIQFVCAVKVLVHQNWPIWIDFDSIFNVSLEVFVTAAGRTLLWSVQSSKLSGSLVLELCGIIDKGMH